MAEPPVPQEIRDEDVLAALEKVPLEFREAVLMADVEEFSYREIAETMRIPLGTVMSRLSRGENSCVPNWLRLRGPLESGSGGKRRDKVDPYESA